jgi:ubiquinone/menaquinone biosynthesis C-methylase UbiE
MNLTSCNFSSAGSNVSLEFAEASAEALPFDDSTFDAVTIAFGLRNVNSLSLTHTHARARAHTYTFAFITLGQRLHLNFHLFLQVTNTSKALSECLRVLKKGGRFMCV